MAQPDSLSAPTVTLTPEEQDQLRKARSRIKDKAFRDKLIADRGALTYAQRRAQARAKRENAEKKKTDNARERAARVERKQRAYALWAGGMTKALVSVELGVSRTTVDQWLKGMTRPGGGLPEKEPDPINEELDRVVHEAVADVRLMARDEEQQSLLDVAEANDTPQNQYQAYIAASAIRLLRDSIPLVRGPRTVRELSELDQLIRRNLGLNAKGGGAGGTLTIDVSILNNTKASNGAIGRVVVVEAERV